MPGVPMYIRVQLRTYTYGTRATVPVPSVHRSTTRNTPWTRPAARHGTRGVPRERSIHISRVAPPAPLHGTPFLPSLSNARSSLFSLVSLSCTALFTHDTLLFFYVIGSKVNRSKVIFSFRSLPFVPPRKRSVSCLSFFS